MSQEVAVDIQFRKGTITIHTLRSNSNVDKTYGRADEKKSVYAGVI